MTVQLVAFDLDDTLAPSKSPLDPSMAELLIALLQRVPVAIISGGNESQFRTQVIAQLTQAAPKDLDRLHLLPTCGTRYLRYDGSDFAPLYAHDLPADQRALALAVVEEEARRLGLWADQTWGPILEDRGSQITFSALGQAAPGPQKHEWDPQGNKRARLRDAVAPRLPLLEVRSGGSTSIDITQAGIDKAFGMKELSARTGIALENMLFYGDRLDQGGNDYPVAAIGVPSVAVTGWQDTAERLAELIPTL